MQTRQGRRESIAGVGEVGEGLEGVGVAAGGGPAEGDEEDIGGELQEDNGVSIG